MINRTVSLLDIVKLNSNPELSEKYVSHICGFNEGHKYRHDEIISIHAMLEILHLNVKSADGFLYGYEIPQLNKEFDLLKVTRDRCLNIEIKSHSVPLDRIKKQLCRNKHFLKILNLSLNIFAFDFETKNFYEFNDKNELSIVDSTTVAMIVSLVGDAVEADLDYAFKPSNILVSPLNDPIKFFEHQYLLTEHQETIKEKILSSLNDAVGQKFFGLTGGPGTGKTLLLYDIAFDIAKSGQSVLVIHSGIICHGHEVLNTKLGTLKIVWAKSLRYRELKGYDVVVVDESQRIYTSIIEKIERWVNKANKKCIFSFDESQTMSKSEDRRDAPSLIKNLCTENFIFKLTNKIRTNKEIALFITCLRDLSKFRKEYSFNNVSIEFEPDRVKAVDIAKDSESKGYKYVSYTSSYYDSSLNYQENDSNAHRVIGQEFDGVVMILNDKFYYEGNVLKALPHPNSDYLYTRLLYQGLTRTRTKLKLIIQTEELLDKIMVLFGK